jgi:hypothetical protein
MNPLVIVFFLHNVLATGILGYLFFKRKDPVVKNFGLALSLLSVAFGVWTLAIMSKTANLDVFVTFGVLFLIGAIVAFLNAGTQHLNGDTRKILLIVAGVMGLLLLYLRSFVFPSQPGFSPEGFFFFNAHPIVQMIYVFGLALTTFPAIEALASRFKGCPALLIRYGFIAEVVGGILLITNINIPVLVLTGFIIGVVYFALWTTFAFSKKAWSEIH